MDREKLTEAVSTESPFRGKENGNVQRWLHGTGDNAAHSWAERRCQVQGLQGVTAMRTPLQSEDSSGREKLPSAILSRRSGEKGYQPILFLQDTSAHTHVPTPHPTCPPRAGSFLSAPQWQVPSAKPTPVRPNTMQVSFPAVSFSSPSFKPSCGFEAAHSGKTSP